MLAQIATFTRSRPLFDLFSITFIPCHYGMSSLIFPLDVKDFHECFTKASQDKDEEPKFVEQHLNNNDYPPNKVKF